MPRTKLKTKDYRLKTEINKSVNSLMPHCFFGLHLTFRLERGLNCKKLEHPFLLFANDQMKQ